MDLAVLENQRRTERCESDLDLCPMALDDHFVDAGQKGVKVGEGTFANVYKGGEASFGSC